MKKRLGAVTRSAVALAGRSEARPEPTRAPAAAVRTKTTSTGVLRAQNKKMHAPDGVIMSHLIT